MKFGDLIRATRIRQDIDVDKLSDLSGMSSTTISRIESGEAEPSLPTAIWLCEALGISAQGLLREVIPEYPHSEFDRSLPKTVLALTVDDIIDFVNFFWSHISEGLALLTREFSKTLQGWQPLYSQPDYSPRVITELLAGNPMYQLSWTQPPASSKAKYYEEIYGNGGVLTYDEIGQYSKILRKKNAANPSNFATTPKLSASMINRIENGNIEKIRLKSLFLVEQHYDTGGALLNMYWQATRLSEQLRIIRIKRFPKRAMESFEETFIKEEHLAQMLITICRWRVPMDKDEFYAWLPEFRKMLHQSISVDFRSSEG